MDLMRKLEILTDAAKYDAACTSSGMDRKGEKGKLGSAVAPSKHKAEMAAAAAALQAKSWLKKA